MERNFPGYENRRAENEGAPTRSGVALCATVIAAAALSLFSPAFTGLRTAEMALATVQKIDTDLFPHSTAHQTVLSISEPRRRTHSLDALSDYAFAATDPKQVMSMAELATPAHPALARAILRDGPVTRKQERIIYNTSREGQRDRIESQLTQRGENNGTP